MAGDPRAGSAAQIAAKARPRKGYGYVETRHCHLCQQPGHLRQACPNAKPYKDKDGEDDEEAVNALRLSADPLPILHDDAVRWQGATREVPVHPHQAEAEWRPYGGPSVSDGQ